MGAVGFSVVAPASRIGGGDFPRTGAWALVVGGLLDCGGGCGVRSGACALVVGGSLTGGGHCGLSLWRLGLRGAMVGGVLAGVGGGAGFGVITSLKMKLHEPLIIFNYPI